MNPELRKQIALLIHTSGAWTRQVMAGVSEYAKSIGNWDFWIEPRGFYDQITLPEDWYGDGVICRLTNDKLRQQVERRSLPTVNVSWLSEHSKTIPKVVSDEQACGKMAAEFFLQRGWSHFGFVGPPPGLDYSDRTELAFQELILQSGHAVFRFDHHLEFGLLTVGQQQPQMMEWLRAVPKPIVLLVWTTNIGHEITLLARQIGLSVPDDIAILAVEMDPLISSLCPVPISYIDQSPRRVGARAAEVLDQMIKGESPPEQPLLIPPLAIAERMSLDTLFTKDELIRRAIDYIRVNLENPLQVSEVAEAVSISRRSLEHRFEQTLGRSPAQVIRQNRLSQAKHLLRETGLTVAEIAYRTGHEHVETFNRFFKRETGTTPTEFRTGRT